MSTWAVIPMKPLRNAKSRLREAIGEEEKDRLVLTLYRHTLALMRDSRKLDAFAVITADKKLQQIAESYGAHVVEESDPIGLNESLKNAMPYFIKQKVDNLLVLPGDLPYMNQPVLLDLAREMEKRNLLMISPDQDLTGTNGLCFNPIWKMKFFFGESSFHKHVHFGKDSRYDVKLYISDALKHDIDTPKDLEQHQKIIQYHLDNASEEIHP
jgi:2-phospho-L-lactate guanylyltransferase